jgi:hypothetical protein
VTALKTRWNLLLGLVLTALAGCGTPQFTPFSPEGGQFKIVMPGAPREETRETKSGQLHLYTAEFSHGAYSVQWIDLPGARDEGEEALKKRLNAERDAGVKEVSGKIVKDDEITLDGKYPGRDFTADVPSVGGQSGQMRVRLYLVRGRLFQIMVVGKKSFLESAEVGKFFDSFTFLPK